MDWDLPEENLDLVCRARGLPPAFEATSCEAIERPLVMVGFGGLGLPSIQPFSRLAGAHGL